MPLWKEVIKKKHTELWQHEDKTRYRSWSADVNGWCIDKTVYGAYDMTIILSDYQKWYKDQGEKILSAVCLKV